MSDATPAIDFRSRFIKLLGAAVIAAVLFVLAWAIFTIVQNTLADTLELRCRANLKRILEGIELYSRRYPGRRPPYLAALLPVLEGHASVLVCPADPGKGTKGCRPLWLRKDDGDLFDHVNLDGPGLTPDTAEDTVPCSYLYVANCYPCGLTQFKKTWKDVFAETWNKYKDATPLIRCYYHLPEQQVNDKNDLDLSARPTWNITAGGQLWEYPLYWQSDPKAKPR